MRVSHFREWYERYERHISAVTILIAFFVDSITLVRVDVFLTNFLLFLYLAIVAFGILVVNLYEAGKLRWLSYEWYAWITLAMQFSFGGLFGRFLIYYSRAGLFASSWPFLVLLAGLLVGNEFAKKYYTRVVVQVGFFFLALFAYMIFFVPIVVGRMGDAIFLLSGSVSLLIVGFFIHILMRLLPTKIKEGGRALIVTVASVFIVFNALYFANLIPPLPLALRDAGVFHSITPTSTGFIGLHEESTAANDYLARYATVHLVLGERLYVYSAVFAPTNFDTDITHEWQWYEPQTKRWESLDRITFNIVGGQDRGYRGYTFKSNLRAGLWRVNILTASGQLVGREQINVVLVPKKVALVKENL